MDELKKIDNKNYKKLDIESVEVDGKKSTNTVSGKEMMKKQNIIMNITVKTPSTKQIEEDTDINKDEKV